MSITDKKICVAILFGGKSAEHSVSLQSANNVIKAIDRDRYDVIPIGIVRSGQWFAFRNTKFLFDQNNPNSIRINSDEGVHVALVPQSGGTLINLSNNTKFCDVDVVFPLLHGPFGEDGTIQGLLKLADVPFVGSGVLGSAIGMDKDVAKRLLREAGLPVGRFIALDREKTFDYDKIAVELGMPVFVKPANLGSSVGISKVSIKVDLARAIEIAFRYDKKILIESFIDGREVECGVLGNQNPIASVVGEIIPLHDFYSYQAKYLDKNGATSTIPAKIDDAISAQVRELAVKAFKVLCCEGLARVDFFLKHDGSLVINEINTIPGFTDISMYPRLFEAAGISYRDLVNKLITFAIDRFAQDKFLEE